jgi:hypothetical protein
VRVNAVEYASCRYVPCRASIKPSLASFVLCFFFFFDTNELKSIWFLKGLEGGIFFIFFGV